MGRPLGSKNKPVTPPAPPPPPTREERIHNCLWYLNHQIKQSKDLRDKIVGLMLKDDELYNAVYEIRWLQGKVRSLQLGVYCQAILYNVQDTTDARTFEEKLEASLSCLENQKESWYPESSSSPFSNACRLEDYDALREMVREIKAYVNHMKE